MINKTTKLQKVLPLVFQRIQRTQRPYNPHRRDVFGGTSLIVILVVGCCGCVILGAFCGKLRESMKRKAYQSGTNDVPMDNHGIGGDRMNDHTEDFLSPAPSYPIHAPPTQPSYQPFDANASPAPPVPGMPAIPPTQPGYPAGPAYPPVNPPPYPPAPGSQTPYPPGPVYPPMPDAGANPPYPAANAPPYPTA